MNKNIYCNCHGCYNVIRLHATFLFAGRFNNEYIVTEIIDDQTWRRNIQFHCTG